MPFTDPDEGGQSGSETGFDPVAGQMGKGPGGPRGGRVGRIGGKIGKAPKNPMKALERVEARETAAKERKQKAQIKRHTREAEEAHLNEVGGYIRANSPKEVKQNIKAAKAEMRQARLYPGERKAYNTAKTVLGSSAIKYPAIGAATIIATDALTGDGLDLTRDISKTVGGWAREGASRVGNFVKGLNPFD